VCRPVAAFAASYRAHELLEDGIIRGSCDVAGLRRQHGPRGHARDRRFLRLASRVPPLQLVGGGSRPVAQVDVDIPEQALER
jgi:hypothetical protein